MNAAHFSKARTIADTVLFEGYLLYPYRASAPKNRSRWQFGVVAPPLWAKVRGSDTDVLEVVFLVEAEGQAEISGQLRFLHLRRRRVEQAAPGGHRFHEVDSLDVGARLYLPWEEADVREIAVGVRLGPGGSAGSSTSFRYPGSIDTEPVRDVEGVLRGRVLREALPLSGQVSFATTRLSERLHRVTARIANLSDFSRLDDPREEAMRASLLGAHLLLAVEGGRFVSLVDPPAFAADAAKACRNVGLFPVLVDDGRDEDLDPEEDGQDVLLASPLILEDHPRIAPESRGDFYDACEIDELLTLRTMTLTDLEKREARATDVRAAAILDRVESGGSDSLARLHGAFREIPLASRFAPGARVRLRPGPRRTDAQDMFLRGMTARVEAVMQDVDGRDCLAVTVDDDPATDLYRSQGRYLYFYEDEVEAP